MITIYVDETRDNWDEHLTKLAFAYNSSIHNGTRISPFDMRFGQTPRIPCEIVLGSETAARPIIEYEDHIQNNAETIQGCPRPNRRLPAET